jgi:hypothetical protein
LGTGLAIRTAGFDALAEIIRAKYVQIILSMLMLLAMVDAAAEAEQ